MSIKRIFWYITALVGSTGVWAQQGSPDPQGMLFFAEQARSDAQYEQKLNLQGPNEELDFWTDQRDFERLLYIENLPAYKTYIRAKRDEYSSHQSRCSMDCGHGDYYYLQASFYLQLGSDSDGNSWMFDTMRSGGGLIAAGPEN